jgi:hypothetical protein
MPRTVVGLFRDRNAADQAVRAIEAAGFSPNEVSRVEEPDGFEVSGVMSFPRLDFETALSRGLKRIGASEAETQAYLERLREGGTVVFATDTDENKVRAAADIMCRHNAAEVEEGRGPQPQAPVDIGEGRTANERLDIAGRVQQAPQPGNRYFSW